MKKSKFCRRYWKEIVVLGLFASAIFSIFIYWGYERIQEDHTEFYFIKESDLPDPGASLRNPKLQEIGVNVIDVGKTYAVKFTVDSKQKKRADYIYRYSSGMGDGSDSFSLEPGEKKTITLTVTPDESDKWKYEYSKGYNSEGTYDLPKDAFLGERIDFNKAIVMGDVVRDYSYAPFQVGVEDLGKVLNVNTTLEQLASKPFTSTQSNSDENEYNKRITTIRRSLSRDGKALKNNINLTTEFYVSNPEVFTITLYVLNGEDETTSKKQLLRNTTSSFDRSDKFDKSMTIDFWYKIK